MKDEPEQQTEVPLRYGITPVSLFYVGSLLLLGVPLLLNAVFKFLGWFSLLLGN